MKFFNFLGSLFIIKEKNKNCQVNKSMIFDTLDISSELKELFVDYKCENVESLICALVQREMLGQDLSEEEEKVLNHPEMEFLKDFAYFTITLHREHKEQRSIAVMRLVDRNAKIEEQNEFDELVNYTIRFFSFLYSVHPDQFLNRIRECFPTMASFIIREVIARDSVLPIPPEFNVQKAYDEFLFYVSNHFIELYPVAAVRNQHIRIEFRLIKESLIQFIEKDLQKMNRI